MNDRDHRSTDPTDSETSADGTWRVTIPDHVGEKIEHRLPETNFDSADEYVTFVLESVLREIAEQDDDVNIRVVADGDAAPENSDAIQDRLESLGYL